MKLSIAATLITLLALTAQVAAHAGEDDQSDRRTQNNSAKLNGSKLNGSKLNGAKFNGPGLILQGRTMNGIGFNGPGVVLQGRTMNGIGFNGPGIVLQGNRFNGIRFNGFATAGFNASETELDLVSVENCAAPPPAREWPLSALTASSVNVRLAPR